MSACIILSILAWYLLFSIRILSIIIILIMIYRNYSLKLNHNFKNFWSDRSNISAVSDYGSDVSPILSNCAFESIHTMLFSIHCNFLPKGGHDVQGKRNDTSLTFSGKLWGKKKSPRVLWLGFSPFVALCPQIADFKNALRYFFPLGGTGWLVKARDGFFLPPGSLGSGKTSTGYVW